MTAPRLISATRTKAKILRHRLEFLSPSTDSELTGDGSHGHPLRGPKNPHLPPSSTSAVSLSSPYTFSLCLYAFSSFTHTMNVGVTRDSLLGSPGGSVVKNLSARAGDMNSIPDLGRPSTAKNQSINQYFFNKGSRLHPLLHILPP